MDSSISHGDRRSMGGVFPQYRFFAKYIYDHIISGDLNEVRIGDKTAGTLDDILFETKDGIIAFQVKWSNQEPPANLAFGDFKNWLPGFVTSWQELRKEGKSVHSGLLTNRSFSAHLTSILAVPQVSFEKFLTEFWQPLRKGTPLSEKWSNALNALSQLVGFSEAEIQEFAQFFEVRGVSELDSLHASSRHNDQQERDVRTIQHFLFHDLANRKSNVVYTADELQKQLNFHRRIAPTFNHDLRLDPKVYQPIAKTEIELNQMIENIDSGYFFLLGGPGTGKSSLLTNWSHKRPETVIRYFTFNFTDPSDISNPRRGETISLFHDLIVQLKSQGVSYGHDVLIHDDLDFLLEAFKNQLSELGNDYNSNKSSTILIIDGIDHIPREYTSVDRSFLEFMPHPSSIPKGVRIIIGSQKLDVLGLSPAVRREGENPNRVTKISSLDYNAVRLYVDAHDLTLMDPQLARLFTLSEGHPLYLTYLVELLGDSSDIESELDEIVPFAGDIDLYYRRLWEDIKDNYNSQKILGLLSRINGSVKLNFINEWGFQQKDYDVFSRNCIQLFRKANSTLTFFHNSFVQFVRERTATNPLLETFDLDLDISYHREIIKYYEDSQVEASWKRIPHIAKECEYRYSKSGDQEEFSALFEVAQPDVLMSHFEEFRPSSEIRNDIRLCIRACKLSRNKLLLLRYLLALTDYESRMNHLDDASSIPLLIDAGELEAASLLLRDRHLLLGTKEEAIRASSMFLAKGQQYDSDILFRLGTPKGISESTITINHEYQVDRALEPIENWLSAATSYFSTEQLLTRIRGLEYLNPHDETDAPSEQEVKLRILHSLCLSYVEKREFISFQECLKELIKIPEHLHMLFLVLHDTMRAFPPQKESAWSSFCLDMMEKSFDANKISTTKRLIIANWKLTFTGNSDHLNSAIKGVEQPKLQTDYHGTSDSSLSFYHHRILFNKFKHILGESVSIIDAVADPGSHRAYVEFERILCLLSRIMARPYLQSDDGVDLMTTSRTLIRFFYYNKHKDSWFSIKQKRLGLMEKLISSVSSIGSSQLTDLAHFFFSEFKSEAKYWDVDSKIMILASLLEFGVCNEEIDRELSDFAEFALTGSDITGRIERCHRLARLYIDLGNNEKAKNWIRKSYVSSSGVGYRKDYQMETWLDWLEKTIDQDSKDALETINWLANSLYVIETQSENAGSRAADKLLSLCFRASRNHGFILLDWLLSKGLISYGEAVNEVIHAHTRNPEECGISVAIFSNVLLPISTSARTYSLKVLLDSLFESDHERLITQYLYQIYVGIKLNALEEYRGNYIEVIEEFLSSKEIKSSTLPFHLLPKSNFLYDERRGTSVTTNELQLADGTVYSYPEVQSKTLTQEGLLATFKLESKYPDFDWNPLIEERKDDLDFSTIESLAKCAGKKGRGSKLMAKLGGMMAKLGRKDRAVSTFRAALAETSSSGWDMAYDGGARLSIFKEYSSYYPEESRELAFNHFTEDVLNSNYPGSYSLAFNQILPFISAESRCQDYWNEIDSYLRRIVNLESDPEDIFKKLELRDDLSYLAEFIQREACSPIGHISGMYTEVLHRVIREESSVTIFSCLQSASLRSDDFSELVLRLLKVEARIDISIVENFKEQLIVLSNSDNYLVRKESYFLLKTIAEDKKNIRQSIPLPPIFDLLLPEIPEPSKELDLPDNYVKDTSNLKAFVGPNLKLLEILAKQVNLPIENLLVRIEQLIKLKGSINHTTRQYEVEYLSRIDRTSLTYFSIIRPRYTQVRKAILHLTSELMDSGYLRGNSLVDDMIFYDPELELIETEETPKWVVPIAKESRVATSKEWLEINDSHERVDIGLTRTIEDRFLLAEQYINKGLYWTQSSEILTTQLVIGNSRQKKDIGTFEREISVPIDQYYDIDFNRSILQLVIQNRNIFQAETVRNEWLAFNPDIAKELGWISDTTLFGWCDTFGMPVVQSHYWRNGHSQMRPPHFKTNIGEGWYISVTAEGLRQILEKFNSVFVETAVHRRLIDDGTPFTNSYTHRIAFDESELGKEFSKLR